MADTSQYGYSLDYRRMTIGPGFDLQSSVMSAPKYTRRLDFTTGKRLTEKDGELLSSDCEAVALANELEGMRESTRDLASHTCRVVAK